MDASRVHELRHAAADMISRQNGSAAQLVVDAFVAGLTLITYLAEPEEKPSLNAGKRLKEAVLDLKRLKRPFRDLHATVLGTVRDLVAATDGRGAQNVIDAFRAVKVMQMYGEDRGESYRAALKRLDASFDALEEGECS